MFVTKNQIFVFLACVAIGGIGGIFFTFSAFVKFFIKNKRFKFIPDVAAFSVFTVMYTYLSYSLQFPSYRVYMTAAAFVGLFLYMKSFHITLALCAEKLYNIIKKKINGLKVKRKASVKKDAKNNERRNHIGKRKHARCAKRNGNRFGCKV